MREIGREVEVRLESPAIVGLKLINESRSDFSGHVRETRRVACVGSKEDAKKYRRFAIRVSPKSEPDISDFKGIERFGSLGYGLSELRLIDDSGGDIHSLIIPRLARFVEAPE